MFFKKRPTTYTPREKHVGAGKRFFRSIFAVVMVSFLVLFVGYLVGQLYALSPEKISGFIASSSQEMGLPGKKLGQVAGDFAERVSQTSIEGYISEQNNVQKDTTPVTKYDIQQDIIASSTVRGDENVLFKFALFADVESDFDNLEKALTSVKAENPDFIFFIGDVATYGELGDLTQAKELMDSSGFVYYPLPGDHDLAASVNLGDESGLANYKKVFGDNFGFFTHKGMSFLYMDNSANYTTLNPTLLNWFDSNVSDTDVLILSQPLYHSIGNRVMGKIDGVITPAVYDQGQVILKEVQESRITNIFAADLHSSSKSVDPVRETLSHYVVGALVGNDDQIRNLQSPRYSLVTVFADKTIKVRDITID